VRVGAALAAAGALLALVAGLGRTSLAMAREGDLPRWLDAVHPTYQVPHRAELSIAAVVVAIVLLVDLRGAIGFSSFGVLLYYFVANAAARAQGAEQRRYPRWLQALGCAGCLVLVATLPWQSVVAGAAVFAVGIVGRLVRLRR
jgi:APA family basic amino acid/polyamine antiporter